MEDERMLYLKDLLKEIDKVQEEIEATRDFDRSAVAMHNGLTLAKALAYKVVITGRGKNENNNFLRYSI